MQVSQQELTQYAIDELKVLGLSYESADHIGRSQDREWVEFVRTNELDLWIIHDPLAEIPVSFVYWHN